MSMRKKIFACLVLLGFYVSCDAVNLNNEKNIRVHNNKITIKVNVQGLDKFFPLLIYAKHGKWVHGTAWATFDPKSGVEELLKPENEQLLTSNSQEFNFNIAESSYFSIFVVSKEQGIFFAKSIQLEADKRKFEIKIDLEEFMIIEGNIKNTDGNFASRSSIFLGNNEYNDLSSPMAISDEKGKFRLMVWPPGLYTLLVKGRYDNWDWEKVYPSTDKEGLVFHLRDRADVFSVFLETDSKSNGFSEINEISPHVFYYEGITSVFMMSESEVDDSDIIIAGLPLGEPYLNIWMPSIPRTQNINYGVIRKLQVLDTETQDIKIPLIESTKRYKIKFDNSIRIKPNSNIRVSGYRETGEYFVSFHSINGSSPEIEIPDFDEFQIIGKLYSDSFVHDINQRVRRDDVAGSEIQIELNRNLNANITAQLANLPDEAESVVRLYAGKVDPTAVFIARDIFCMQLIREIPLKKSQDVFQIESLDTGVYTVVINSFVSEGYGPVSKHYVGYSLIEINSSDDEVKLNVELVDKSLY